MSKDLARRILNAARDGAPISSETITRALRVLGDICDDRRALIWRNAR
jgi:hypothetical protein